MGIAIKVVIRSYFRPEVYKLYQFGLPSIPKAKNLVLIIRNLIYWNKYLSQGLIAILRKMTQATAAERWGSGGRGTPPPRTPTTANTKH